MPAASHAAGWGGWVEESQRIAVLNALRNEINSVYGFRDGAPRVNLGPCGRFAKAFREQWNGRFKERVNIAFVMSNEREECFHVLLKLPDGRYYDGGNGVMTEGFLLALYPGARVEEMKQYDLELLDQRSYGLKRGYPLCTNYSDAITAKLIRSHLEKLPK
jgi:hypothetical protein